ncbi:MULTISPECIES: polysaccharide lyase 8 family protein [unclassified Enterococcus]|uniref:polysaccharide lyase 8 family protein n=1 Tax=unclassified Enterococcus TaxID=2608891 RepID=UPI001CE0D1D6|nr:MULTISPECIES: polysaccharide lyase 8 family protein [unclassified Enterococcus]MCA5014476.1 polysaccharide lyase 8 family protein [Enterococcus sp. S23]MCA5017410.1 polysaccharide lyase 8 family protein [Enterococcus sp. S22(2020)]
MKTGKKVLFAVGCSFAIFSGLYGFSKIGLAEEGANVIQAEPPAYTSDFPNQLGTWQDMVGKADKSNNSSGLMISNTKQGTSLESVSLNLSAGKQTSGDLEYTFLYEGQANFGLVFRGDTQNSSKWQSFAYNRDGQWQLGQPGGKWIANIPGPKLSTGQQYKLMLRYEGKSIKAFLNDQLFYENNDVVYPNGSAIDGDWEGYPGIRMFGNLSKLTVLSMRSGKVGSIPVVDRSAEYAQLKEKWRNQLVSDQYDETNPTLVKYVQTLSEEAAELYQTMNKSADRTYLWPLEQGNTASADLSTQFIKLQKLALAYGTKGSPMYQDKTVEAAIIDGLDFMVTKKGYDGKKYHGNWWDWQVGIPQKFISTLMILGDNVPEEKLQQYTAAISGYVPDPFKQLYTKTQGTFVDLAFIPNFVTSGANRTDLALTVLGLGILQKNEGKITQASSSIIDVFKLVTKGDGFYKDGSFIQHSNIPYTGSYGNVLIKGVGQILAITKESSFEMAPEIVNEFVENVDRAFLPLIYKGEMLPTVNGRSISRAPAKTKVGYGSTTIYNLLIVSKFAPTEYQKKFQEAAKYWIKENPDYYLTNARDFNDLQMTMTLLDNSGIIGETLPFIGTKMYASMDRFVQRTPVYMMGLGLYSSRISSFEAGNKENRRGWHTADGMMYLYNDDEVQFNSAYWPTVDPYRLPGTTVDTVALADEVSAFTTVTSKEKWVGGVDFEGLATVGMALNKTGTKNNGTLLPMNLQAKKSWFIVDGQIVALGAGIKGDTTASIETIVDNRLLNDNYTYKVISNNSAIKQASEVSSKQWLLLQSDHQNASIGYYFPKETAVNVISETRTGSYAQINEAFPNNEQYTGDYRKFVIDHGKNPVDESYAYVTLPGIDEAGLKAYAAEKPVNILANTAEVQAVELPQENYLGVNIWKETGSSIAGITSDKAVSLLKKTSGNQQTYVFSDPTQTSKTMTLKLPKNYSKIVSQSEGIIYDAATDTFTVTFEQMDGSSKQIVVE